MIHGVTGGGDGEGRPRVHQHVGDYRGRRARKRAETILGEAWREARGQYFKEVINEKDQRD